MLKPPTTARRVQRVSSLVGVACVNAAPARRRPEITWRARVGLTLWPRPRPFLAHPAAVALLWRPPRRSALAAGATGFCAAGLSSALRGEFARAPARCVPPCVLAVGALPLAFRSRERRKPPLLANCARPPAVAPCRWAFSALAAGVTALCRCFQRPERVSHSAAAPFSGLPRFNRRFKAVLVPGGACPP